MAGLSRTAPCRGCGKEIAFIKTVKGKTMPVNPESVYFIPGGGPNTYVMIDGTVERGREPTWEDQGTPAQIGYISHFATCPERDRFRKKEKTVRERPLTDGIKVQIDGKKVAEAMQGIDPRASRDSTPGV